VSSQNLSIWKIAWREEKVVGIWVCSGYFTWEPNILTCVLTAAPLCASAESGGGGSKLSTVYFSIRLLSKDLSDSSMCCRNWSKEGRAANGQKSEWVVTWALRTVSWTNQPASAKIGELQCSDAWGFFRRSSWKQMKGLLLSVTAPEPQTECT
jgi:hypothetical protein